MAIAEPVRRPVLLYDGDCGFCTRSARVARRILRGDCTVASWQETDLVALGTNAARAQQEVLWLSRSGSVSGGARAIAHALLAAGFPWALLGVLLLTPPLSWVARGVYRLVAANRMRLPGGTADCAVPPTEAAG